MVCTGDPYQVAPLTRHGLDPDARMRLPPPSLSHISREIWHFSSLITPHRDNSRS
jgi:hypothetical protein